jgi:hypothetical protein
MLAAILVLFARIRGTARYRAAFAYVDDFGFFANGTLTFTWDWLPRGKPYHVRMMVMTSREYSRWHGAILSTGRSHECGAVDCFANWTTTLNSTAVTREFTFREQQVYTVVVQHCSEDHGGRYSIDARFMNSDGQHLDFRQIPSLTVLLVVIPVFSALLCPWLVCVCLKRRKFSGIHAYLAVINFFYVLFLVFHRISLGIAQRTDDATVWLSLRIVFECSYGVALLSTLVVGSRGWGLLNVHIGIKTLVASVVGASLFVASCFPQICVAVAGWEVLVLVVEVVSLFWIWRLIAANAAEAQNHIKAHLLVIRNSGIVPSTTPISQKFLLYRVLMWIGGAAIFTFVTLNVFMATMNSLDWVIALVNNLIQLATICVLMFLHRPRGTSVDQFMQPDVAEDGRQRDEVLLEDLDGFHVQDAAEGTRDWEEGMNLPLQPLVASSKGPKRKRKPEDEAYAEVEDQTE